jgi:hypothetical protein
MAKNKKIERPRLILCEGKDAVYYLIELLKIFIEQDSRFEDYQALDFEGNSDLRPYLGTLRAMEGYERVQSIVVVRDAEKNAESAVQSIVGAFRAYGFGCPSTPCVMSNAGTPRTGFVLFPSCCDELENGTLEDLCLRTLSKEDSNDILSRVDTLVGDLHFRSPHKNRLHTYFSLTDDYVSCKIGEAAKARAFNFNSPEIESLRRFLSQML